ncbi:YesL family protein [Peribacillus loiseleuriae]|uniref:Membrane protein n=1 Tax=Peribacillus loiseleuriae TaxID=1679170 RepID=A0A0K9GX65_9BACI|nr:YesL family protein [Peribacillus loiseleuriae]KMY51228.1 membrane protein [Peribacillus loiseleuriae]
MQKTMGKLFTVCEWIMRLAFVNLLWILFSIAGLLVFGIMPASVALFTIVRKWQMKETDIPVLKTFLTVYRQEFKRSNGLGFGLSLGGAFLIFDFLYLRTVHGALQLALLVPLMIIAAFYITTALYILPVYVHYDLKMITNLKNAFFLGILNFHMTLLMLVTLAAIIILILYQPGLVPFFSVVSIAWILMFGGIYSFNRIEARQSKVSGG